MLRPYQTNLVFSKIFLIIISLEGVIALPFLWQIPSMQRSSWLFGFSPSRLLVLLLFGGAILFLLVYTGRFIFDRSWSASVNDRIHSFLINPKHYWPLLFGTALISFFGCLFVISFNSGPDELKNGLFGVVYLRIQPVVAWLTLVSLEIEAYLLLVVKRAKLALGDRYLSATIVVFLIASLAAFIYWLMLYLDIPWIHNIKDWYWVYFEKGGIHGIRLLGLLLLSLVVFGLVYLSRLSIPLRLVILMVFGYCLMIGMGYVEGNNGFEILRLRHISLNNQSVYSRFVSHRWVTPGLVLENYEDYATSTMFIGAKPPGALYVYSVLQEVSESLLHPADIHADRLLKVTQVISVVFPLFSVLALPLLYAVARRFMDERDALIPCILYLTAPNLLLMPVGLDKALFPALFLIGIYLILKNSELRTFSSSLLLGFYLYIALFFSFSLLPLLLWSPLWLLMDGYGRNRASLRQRLILPLSGIGLGFLASALIFYLLIDYNIVIRYLGAMEWHRYANQFQLTLAFLWNAFVVNNVELASWTSFPLIIIAGVQISISVVLSFRHRSKQMDAFLMVFLIVYICLNLIGQMHAEVGRTWLFLVCVFTLAAGYFISHAKNLRLMATLTLVTLQLVTTYFLLAYQCPCIGPG